MQARSPVIVGRVDVERLRVDEQLLDALEMTVQRRQVNRQHPERPASANASTLQEVISRMSNQCGPNDHQEMD